MAYCTSAQLKVALPELAQAQATAESGVTIDTTILDEVIDQASSRIDLYIGARYSTPVTSPASSLAILRVWCVNICAWMLLKRRLIASENEEITKDYDLTLEELCAVRDNDLAIPGLVATGIGSTPDVEDYAPIVGSETQVFGKEAWAV